MVADPRSGQQGEPELQTVDRWNCEAALAAINAEIESGDVRL